MKFALLTASLALGATSAAAQSTVERTTTFAKGQTFTTQTETVRSGNTRTVTTTGVGSGGGGYDRTANWVWDPVSRSWTKSVTGTTANGRTWSNQGGGSCFAGNCASSSTFTGPNGKTTTRTSRSNRAGGVVTRQTERGNRVREWRRVR